MSARRGQVCEFTHGSQLKRGLIISNDEYNDAPGNTPVALTLSRTQARGYYVALSEDDPGYPGSVRVDGITRVDPTALRRNLGFLPEPTYHEVETALRGLLELF